MNIKKIMCKLGWHFPKKEKVVYTDVDGTEVYEGKCECGITWTHCFHMKIKKG